MSGRGDNNKHGSSGQGSSNQSNQAAEGGEKTPKSNKGEQTGGKASEKQFKSKEKPNKQNTDVDQE